MHTLIGRALAGAAVVALAGIGFAGTALATDTGGNGAGGTATNNCVNVGVPIASGTGIAGKGTANAASCDTQANGTGGDVDEH